nr:DUF1302 family protein [Glaciimonas sp. PCH181]
MPTYAANYAVDTEFGPIQSAWVSNITAGAGIRMKNPSCSRTGDPNSFGCGASANTAQWANGDDGNLNYKRGQLFTGFISGTSELFVTAPQQGMKFLIRGTGMYDFAAGHTNRTELSSSAEGYVVSSVQLLDLWIQKEFEIGNQRSHLRFGNQVINWGESYFASGGINATNSVDIQKLLVPGTQLKQALIPAPMLEFASGLPGGFSTEAYVQFRWNANRYPPVGTYFSVSDVYLHGAQPGVFNATNFNVSGVDAGSIARGSGLNSRNQGIIGGINQDILNGKYPNLAGVPYTTVNPANTPQFGARLGYTPPGQNISYALYYENYTDKSPVLSYASLESSGQFNYLQRRQLFGVSANFPIGDWAIGTELSYRPRDAVALSGCFLAGAPADANTNLASGQCAAYKDNKKYQFDINAQIILTKSTFPQLKLIGADAATFTAELTYIKYPGVNPNKPINSTLNGQSVYQLTDAGYQTWLTNNAALGYPVVTGQGTSDSVGATLDFNWTYDGSLIPGWAVTPGVTFYDALYGYTPTFSANYLQGAKSLNFYVLFNQNPSVWQAGVNLTLYYGGNQLSQPYFDRNFIGFFATRNF